MAVLQNRWVIILGLTINGVMAGLIASLEIGAPSVGAGLLANAVVQ